MYLNVVFFKRQSFTLYENNTEKEKIKISSLFKRNIRLLIVKNNIHIYYASLHDKVMRTFNGLPVLTETVCLPIVFNITIYLYLSCTGIAPSNYIEKYENTILNGPPRKSRL